MSEVRTTSATGGEKGVKPERFSLMPRVGLAAISRVFGFGASKYAAHNWRRGYEWSKSFDALERHVQAAKDGETYDEESGLPHLAHAGFHVLVLLTWLEEQGEGADNPFDDRWPAAMERARRAAEQVEEPELYIAPEFWEQIKVRWGTPDLTTEEKVRAARELLLDAGFLPPRVRFIVGVDSTEDLGPGLLRKHKPHPFTDLDWSDPPLDTVGGND